ncbi:hypothetical protein [Phaeovulum sp. W22_SRMD_FR3]|uniref:hypothetical protein n=1 Tax=Phaeovulum sp. W22_SRMD_FR3 TaxID=3240274 RepID=UPI003F965CF4
MAGSGAWPARVSLILSLTCLAPLAAVAQAAENDSYRILEVVNPPGVTPVSPDATAYRARAAALGVRTDVSYVTRLEGKLVSGKEDQSADFVAPDFSGSGRGLGVALALFLIVAALVAWAKFGGGGALLARAPREAKAKGATAPDGWQISAAEAVRHPAQLLAEIASMPDRGAALVLLLRHCLLSAGAATQTRFARSDTERSAFARLPGRYAHRQGLGTILTTAELAHYGGRPVGASSFEAALQAARALLLGQAPGGEGAHG